MELFGRDFRYIIMILKLRIFQAITLKKENLTVVTGDLLALKKMKDNDFSDSTKQFKKQGLYLTIMLILCSNFTGRCFSCWSS